MAVLIILYHVLSKLKIKQYGSWCFAESVWIGTKWRKKLRKKRRKKSFKAMQYVDAWSLILFFSPSGFNKEANASLAPCDIII